MDWKSHLLAGLFVGILLVVALLLLPVVFVPGSKDVFLLLVILFVSPLVCDLDHYNGQLKKILSILFSVTLIVGLVYSYLFGSFMINQVIMFSAIGLFLVSLLPLFFKHRGFMHSLLFVTIYSLIVGLLSFNFFNGLIAFGVCWSHLWLDKIPFKIK